jgi:hypothetical protein
MTRANPGRRYHCCPRTTNPCNFRKWYDPPITPHLKGLIGGLMDACDDNDQLAEAATIEARRYKKALIATWILISMYVLIRLLI